MSIRLCSLALFTVLIAVASPVFAADSATDQKAASIIELRIKNPNEAKSVLNSLNDSQKDELIRQQAVIDRLLASGSDPEAMSADDKQTLWNATKAIDSIVQGDESVADERLVCRRERKVGSQFSSRVCRNKAQMAADREHARQEVERAQFKAR